MMWNNLFTSTQSGVESSKITSSSTLPSLPEALAEGTKDLHKQVEQHAFVKDLLQDKLESISYHQYLADLKLIYEALEEEIQANLKVCPELQNINFSKLNRHSGLAEDLNSSSFKDFEIQISEAAVNYATHLHRLGQNNPILLVAHAYVRYLGDLSGGMILKKHVEKKWPDALHLYDFSNLLIETKIANVHTFKELYKERLKNLVISDIVQKQLIQEARLAFTFAENMFNAIPLFKHT